MENAFSIYIVFIIVPRGDSPRARVRKSLAYRFLEIQKRKKIRVDIIQERRGCAL